MSENEQQVPPPFLQQLEALWHSTAKVMMGNDSAVAYLYDPCNDRVVRKGYENVEWVA